MRTWQIMNPTPWAEGDEFMMLYGKLLKNVRWDKTNPNMQFISEEAALEYVKTVIGKFHPIRSEYPLMLQLDGVPPEDYTSDRYIVHMKIPMQLRFGSFKIVVVSFIFAENTTFTMDDIGMFESPQAETFLNNRYINCCFFTTYASVLASALKKGANWFTFVTPTIGAPVSPTDSQGSSIFDGVNQADPIDYSDQKDETTADGGRKSPKGRGFFQRPPQRVRKEIIKQAVAPNPKVRVVNVECPVNHELQSRPSQRYQLELDANGETNFGMEPVAEPVKIAEPRKERRNKDGKRRSGNNRRKYSPEPEKTPREKVERTIDEDGFELVTGKKVARLRPQPEEKSDSITEEEEAAEQSPKIKVKTVKKYKPLGPSKATILHDKAQIFDLLLLDAEEEASTEEEEEETVKKAKTTEKKKRCRRVQKKEKPVDLSVLVFKCSEEAKRKDQENLNTIIKCVSWASFILLLFAIGIIFYWWPTLIYRSPEQDNIYSTPLVTKIESPQLETFQYPYRRSIIKPMEIQVDHNQTHIFDFNEANLFNICMADALMG